MSVYTIAISQKKRRKIISETNAVKTDCSFPTDKLNYFWKFCNYDIFILYSKQVGWNYKKFISMIVAIQKLMNSTITER